MRSRDSAALVLALSLAGCVAGGRVAERAGSVGSFAAGSIDQVGYATWYGDELAGHRTASGERFDPDAISAAHRSLPLGSVVEVVALDTGRAILVRVNDRGPYAPGLILDLSRGAMRLLGSGGRTPVRIQTADVSDADLAALARGRPASRRADIPERDLAGMRRRLGMAAGSPAPSNAAPADRDARYIVRIATFASKDRARRLAKALNGRAIEADDLWRVVIGPFDRFEDAQAARDDAARRGYGDAAIVR